VISDLRERDMCDICRSCCLAFAIVFSSIPILIFKWLVIKARDTKCVVVLVRSKWPVWLRRKLTRSKWSFERGKRLKETRSLWLWGTDIPRVHWKDKRPHERPKGPINRKVIPSWAWGGMTSEADRHKAGSVRAQTAQQRRASNHNRDPTFPRWNLVQRNQARMSRQNYRKIGSIGSLFLRGALLSYLHVLPHGRIYKA
jgi:hypothetical protein